MSRLKLLGAQSSRFARLRRQKKGLPIDREERERSRLYASICSRYIAFSQKHIIVILDRRGGSVAVSNIPNLLEGDGSLWRSGDGTRHTKDLRLCLRAQHYFRKPQDAECRVLRMVVT